jgi:hypothetical protein
LDPDVGMDPVPEMDLDPVILKTTVSAEKLTKIVFISVCV